MRWIQATAAVKVNDGEPNVYMAGSFNERPAFLLLKEICMSNSEFYELTQAFQGAIAQAGMALLPEPLPASDNVLFQLRRGYAESPAWFLVQAQEFDPEPLSVGRLRRRAVWSSERIVVALLDLMVSEKWLDRLGDDYYLTDGGRGMIQGLVERRHKIFAPLLSRLPEAEIAPLERLMRRVLDASLTAQPSPGTWCLVHSRHHAPAEDSPTIYKLFQYGADFNAWRDDAHTAAFQPLGVSAFAWEALGFIWRGTATTVQAIFDELPYRGYSRGDYALGLADLTERGWIACSSGDEYQMTDAGRGVREDAERQTDAYFYGSWDCLSADERSELQQRLVTVKALLESLLPGQ
jgi:Helix-turn-helix family